jgi:Fe-S-cluster-containing hydrogenase component 2/CRP-like cAMP-binding protein
MLDILDTEYDGYDPDEGLGARDVNGQLIRVNPAQVKDYDQQVNLYVDFHQVTVPLARPMTDAQGNIILDKEGKTTPRYTTLYDAARELAKHEKEKRQQQNQSKNGPPTFRNEIPILCHQEHLNPVAVCRICLVVVRGKTRRDNGLVPACQFRVKEGLAVFTHLAPDFAASVQTMIPPDVAAAILKALESKEFAERLREMTEPKVAVAIQAAPPDADIANAIQAMAPDAATALLNMPFDVVSSVLKMPPDVPSAVRQLNSTVTVLTELLVADHLTAAASTDRLNEEEDPNELRALARRLKLQSSRFAARQIERGSDDTSRVIAVNHEACILCDRCVRACTDVKHNNVIGRTGKGYITHIGFDLNDPMGGSSCVSCGECMISCPTDALTFKSQVTGQTSTAKMPVPSRAARFKPDVTPTTAAELRREHELFRAIPYKFLLWDSRSVWRRKLPKGEVLCEEGEYGNTAFILMKGSFGVYASAPKGEAVTERDSGWRGLFSLLNVKIKPAAAEPASASPGKLPEGPPENARFGRFIARCTPKDVILGEMTCMNNYPRAATVVALEDSEVFEIGRNVLYLMQRNPASREILNQTYREHALDRELRSLKLLESLTPDVRQKCVEFLAPRVELLRLDPGQIIFKQGALADDFYMVRLGFVKVSQRFQRGEWVLNYLGPGQHFGEIGLLSRVPGAFREHITTSMEGRRTATCTALDHVELVRIRGGDFETLLESVPDLRDSLHEFALGRLEKEEALRAKLLDESLDTFLERGLYLGQSLLVLDLESCTRCDECTKACADTHKGVTRLIREGLRFDNFLVASSCRSCLDPYCLVGCPVDAIHRRDGLQIRIESHCIGCGLCAQNCPYGNINMHDFPAKGDAPGQHAARKATTCDLCSHITKDHHQAPSCVFACPHNAAFRMTGPELKSIVEMRR